MELDICFYAFEVSPPSFFIRNNVRVIGDLVQSWYLILCTSSAPLYFARICCMSPL